MLNQEIHFSEERQTWNLFVDGEWYYEGTYEQVEEAMFNNAMCDAEEEVGCYEPEDDYYPEDDEPYLNNVNYWVSYALQDGTQMGTSLWVNDDDRAYDEIMDWLEQIHGEDEIAIIADYGKYDIWGGQD